MARIVTVTANTLVDFLAVIPWKPGAVNRVERLSSVAGGKALNVARVLAGHGHHVVAVCFAGGPTGEMLQERLRADGVVPSPVPTCARTRLGFQLIDPSAGTATAVLEQGFGVTPGEAEAMVDRVEQSLEGTALVIVGGSVPDASCNDLYARVLACCARASVPCWVDAYGPAMDAALACPHPPLLAKPNRDEFTHPSAWQRCTEMHITDGSRPISIRHPTGCWTVTPPPVREVNPIGSGDCYLAALAHARLTGMSLVDQWRYAASAGAANAARVDVAQVGPEEIAALMDECVVDADL